MEFYFGKLTKTDQEYADLSEMYYDGKHYYWFKCVIDEEDQVCFYDTCNRHFPVGFENIFELNAIVNSCKNYWELKQDSETTLKDIKNKLQRLQGSINE